MKALLKILILGPIAIVVMALAVVNNQPVRLVFDPFTPEAPLPIVCCSMTIVRIPPAAARQAAALPRMPPPITARS